MAKIARYNEYLTEATVTPLKDVIKIDIEDPNVLKIIKFIGNKNYKYNDIFINFSKAMQSHMDDERLRYSAVYGYGNYDNEGKPLNFDWVVYGKTPEDLIEELKRMIPEYIEATDPALVKEAKKTDEWDSLNKDEKIDKLMSKLDNAAKKKRMPASELEIIRKKMNAEIGKSGPDKIRMELMKRSKAEADIKGHGDDDANGANRLDKAKEIVKQEVWKGYKQPVHQFFDTVYDLMSGEQ